MRKIIGLVVMVALVVACNSSKKEQVNSQTDIQNIVVLELFQVSDYTYLRGEEEEEGVEKWVAAPAFQAEVGKTYYFKKGLEMPNFESKELNKTFEKIYFVDQISSDPNFAEIIETQIPVVDTTQIDLTNQMAKPVIEKENITIESGSGITTIANIYKNLKSFEGKVIKVKGKVTKFNAAIMNKNWIHLQDGTDFNGEFDLTVTTSGEFKVGDIITLEGKVALNKDFGYGYSYKLLLEDAVVVN